jgi:autotransporter-associated beta strand protein
MTHALYPMRFLLFLAACFELASLMALAPAVHAADQTWSGGASGNNTAWYTTGNWAGGAVPGAQGSSANTDIATLPSTGTNNPNSTIGINLATPAGNTHSLGALNFTGTINRAMGDSSGASGTVRLNGATVNGVPNVIIRNSSSGAFTLQNNGGGAGTMDIALGNATDNLVNIESTGGVTISSVIKNGTGNHLSLAGAGSGVLTLSAANTYTGGTTVSGSTLAIGDNSALGSGQLTLNGGAVSALGSGFLGNAISNNTVIQANSRVSGSSTLTINGTFTNSGGNNVMNSTNTFALNLNGNVYLSENAAIGRTLTFTGDALNRFFVINGAVADFNGAGTAGNIQVGNGSSSNSATLTLAGNNTHSGETQISTFAVLNVGNAGALGTSTLVATGSGTLSNSTGGALTLSHINNIALRAGSLTFSSSDDLSFGNNTVTMSNGSRSIGVNFSAKLTVGSIVEDASPRSFSKLGTGTLVLLGNSTYTGGTNVSNGGTLQIASGGSINGTSNVSLNGNLIVDGSLTTAGGVTVNAGSTLSGAGTVNGTINVSGGAVAGNLTLNGNVSYTGGTFAPGNSPGTVTMNGADFSFGSGTTLAYDLNGGNMTIGGGINDLLTGVGNLTLDGTLNVTDTSPGSFASAVAGSKWRLINYTGTLTSLTLELGSMPALSGGLSYSIDTSTPNQVNLVVSAVPEASAFIAVGLVGVVGWFARKHLHQV